MNNYLFTKVITKVRIEIHLILLLLLMTACSSQSEIQTTNDDVDIPSWYNQSNPDTLHYYGVGVSDFTKDMQTTADRAYTRAKEQISSQISSQIASIVEDSVIEKEGWSLESFKKCIYQSSNNYLENCEICNRWQSPISGRVFIRTRLSKKQFRAQQQKQFKQMKQVVLINLNAMDYAVSHQDYAQFLSQLISALYHSRFFYGKRVIVEYPPYSGIKIDLSEVLTKRANQYLKELYLFFNDKPESIIGGVSSGKQIIIFAAAINNKDQQVPLKNIPISLRMKGINEQKVIFTNSEGCVTYIFGQVTPFLSTLKIEATIDFNNIYFERENKGFAAKIDFNRLLNGPRVTTTIPIHRISFYPITKECIRSYRLPPNRQFFSVAVQKLLSDSLNAQFTHRRSECDYILNIDANAIYSSEEEGSSGKIYIYKAIAKIDLIAPHNNQVLYTFHLEPPPKHYGTTHERAAESTLRKAALLAKDSVVPEIIHHLAVQE